MCAIRGLEQCTCKTSVVPAPEEITAWDPPKGAMWVPNAIYGGAMTALVLALPIPAWWNAAVLVPGWAVVLVVGSRLYAAVQYVLSADSLTRRSRGKGETMLLTSIASVSGYYEPRVGDFISIETRTQGFSLQLGGDGVDDLLAALGPRLVDLGLDRKVIQDEKTRRWLGLPDGGLRDPWRPPRRDV